MAGLDINDPLYLSQQKEDMYQKLAATHIRSVQFIQMLHEKKHLFVESHEIKNSDQWESSPFYPVLYEKFKDSIDTRIEFNPQTSGILNILPVDLTVNEILVHLTPKELGIFARTSCLCYALSIRDEIWKQKFLQLYSHSKGIPTSAPSSFSSSSDDELFPTEKKEEKKEEKRGEKKKENESENKNQIQNMSPPKGYPWKFFYILQFPTLSANKVEPPIEGSRLIVEGEPWYCMFYENCLIYNIKQTVQQTDWRWFGKGFIKGDNGNLMDFFGVYYWNNSNMGFLCVNDKKKPSSQEQRETLKKWKAKFPPGTELTYYIQWTDPSHPWSKGDYE